MHSGAPFAKKGGSEISLPKMDVPIAVLQWEVFLPEQYKVKDFGGDALAANLLTPAYPGFEAMGIPVGSFQAGVGGGIAPLSLMPGQIGGYIVDANGAIVANARINVTQLDTGAVRSASTDYSGRWIVSNIPSGRVKITASSPGFQTTARELSYDANNPTSYNFSLQVGAVTESIEVQSGKDDRDESRRIEHDLKKRASEASPASSNVLDLQRRVAGVLPVRVDVPRAGTSYSFVRPLVLDEETKLTFNYKSK
jgi:hypothetical protein